MEDRAEEIHVLRSILKRSKSLGIWGQGLGKQFKYLAQEAETHH